MPLARAERTEVLDGVRTHLHTWDGPGPTVWLLHGFTGTGASMGALADGLGLRCCAPDAPGHGRSDAPRDPMAYDLGQTADRLDRLASSTDPGGYHLVGYSMGARLALTWAARHPEQIRSLTVISGHAGIVDPRERADRTKADQALADRIEAEGIEAFVDHWERLALFASQRSLPPEVWEAQRQTRLSQRANGLADSLRVAGAGRMDPVHASLATLPVPVLGIAGALDPKYVAAVGDIVEQVPDGRLVVVPDVGHAPQLEAPDIVAAHIAAFQATDSVRTSG